MAGVPLTIGAKLGQGDFLLEPQQHIIQGLGFPLQVLDIGLYAEVGYGGIENPGSVSLSDIDATPQVIPATEGAVTFPQIVTQDFANDALIFTESGIYTVTIGISLEFLGVNSARHLQVELYNATDVALIRSSNVPIGRNTEGSATTHSFLVEVGAVQLDKSITIRLISAADTFTAVTLDAYAFNAIRIDRLRVS
jgi:hypothetical protein